VRTDLKHAWAETIHSARVSAKMHSGLPGSMPSTRRPLQLGSRENGKDDPKMSLLKKKKRDERNKCNLRGILLPADFLRESVGVVVAHPAVVAQIQLPKHVMNVFIDGVCFPKL
jgi:hypothetical protein